MLAKGDMQQALDLNYEAQSLVIEHHLKSIDSRVETQHAEICFRNGEYKKVALWAKKRNLNIENEVGRQIYFGRLMHYCLFAKMHIYQGNTEEAIKLLNALFLLIEEIKRPEHAKWVLKVRALAHYKTGDTKNALQDLNQALAIAESGKHIQFFLSEGQPMAEMLLTLLKLKKREASMGFDIEGDECSQEYIEEILLHFEQSSGIMPSKEVKKAKNPMQKKQLASKSISLREIEILRYLEAGLPNKEIAARLFISPGTVKRHLENIYEKLNVTSRVKAIIQAKELEYL